MMDCEIKRPGAREYVAALFRGGGGDGGGGGSGGGEDEDEEEGGGEDAGAKVAPKAWLLSGRVPRANDRASAPDRVATAREYWKFIKVGAKHESMEERKNERTKRERQSKQVFCFERGRSVPDLRRPARRPIEVVVRARGVGHGAALST